MEAAGCLDLLVAERMKVPLLCLRCDQQEGEQE